MKAKPIWVLGAMSGTSLDGVDAALLRTNGVDILEFGETAYRPYTKKEREVLRAALGKWQGEDGVAEAAEIVETAHVELIESLPSADLVGFHGQTLAHDPKEGRTHQAGDGRVLARALDTPVVWDFRSNDVELGGEGAPLAPAYHLAASKWAGLSESTAILNLGGVGNLTLVDPSKDRPEDDGALLAFDTGPANAPVNDLMLRTKGLSYDKDGAFARTGRIQRKIVKRFRRDPYFLRMPPKSLDRDGFAWLEDALRGFPDASIAATLVEIAATSVALGLQHADPAPTRLLVTGGGRNNAFLMERIADLSGLPTFPIEEVGLDGDMLEAQAFAYLAARVAFGLPTSFPSTTGVSAAIGGGQISRPNGEG